ncbi:MAG: hypothetical protein WBQ94_24305 [Terracidiphilus sp.]
MEFFRKPETKFVVVRGLQTAQEWVRTAAKSHQIDAHKGTNVLTIRPFMERWLKNSRRLRSGKARLVLALIDGCGEVFARGQRRIQVVGPLLEDEAGVVHEGFWRGA